MISDAFWAKSDRNALSPARKTLLHHSLDVAAAAQVLQRQAPHRLKREADLLGVTPAVLCDVRACLAGWHDIGKASRGFQAKAPPLFPAVFGPLRPDETGQGFDHGLATAYLLTRRVPELLASIVPNLFGREPEAVALTIGGHHGRPLERPVDDYGSFKFRQFIGDPAVEVASEVSIAVWRCLGQPMLPIEDEDGGTKVSRFCWGLAGLTNLADWVGSDTTFFALGEAPEPPETYWPRALEQAAQAARAKGLTPASVSATGGMSALFNIAAPRPMQAAAEAINLPDGPTLVVIEDATGAGKTEAAMVLAHRMMQAGKGEGVYFALPTMATANAMFERLHDAHRRLFAPETRPSLALLHGRRDLSDSFAEIRLAGRTDPDAQDETVAAACAAWIADDRRRALFAEIGAGTIDQALLGVLPKKFFALRQRALAGRILIVDEAHGYDAYVGEELARLLQFHAAAGGSAVILSATLTCSQRQALVDAWCRGLDTVASALSETAYPLMTLVDRDGLHERAIDPTSSSRRRVVVERVGDWAAALDQVVAASRRGAAVAVLRNAVDDVIATQAALAERGCVATVFHARFALCDRFAIERDVVGAFGRRGERRAGRVIIASQVMQESLDCDFDVMITDLAPADLLIQRAGRLWRHHRGGRPVEGPRLIVVAPDWREVRGPDWLSATQPKGAGIYRAGVQWRTARALFPDGDRGALVSPCGLRELVEAAYADEGPPEPLEARDLRRKAEEIAHRQHAKNLGLDWARGYWNARAFGSDQEIGTRLGDETATLRLARLVNGAVLPWSDDHDPARAWALSEVTARVKWLGPCWRDAAPPEGLREAVARAKAAWPDFEQSTHVAVVIRGQVQIMFGDHQRLEYDKVFGLSKVSPRMRGWTVIRDGRR
jgi:CRISPR-associated endonuclease/helicase Cas3